MRRLTFAAIVDLGVDYGRQLVRGMTRAAEETGAFRILVPFLPASPAEVLSSSNRPHGILAMVGSRRECRKLLQYGVPLIIVNDPMLALPGCGTVVPDDEQIGRMAAEYMLSLGAPHFAYYGMGTGWSQARGRAFCERIEAAGRVCHCHDDQHIPTRWIRSLPLPVAIAACNDARAWCVLEAARRAGLRVPEQVAVLGVDNDTLMTELSHPAISTVATEPDRVGYLAAMEMWAMLRRRRGKAPHLRVPPTGVVVRASSDVSHHEDPLLRLALRIIRERAAEGLDVQQLCQALDVSRRLLERRFRATLKQSPLKQIRTARVEMAKHLLRTSAMPISDIAGRCGFDSHTRFGAAFKAVTGTTPSAYRR